MPNTAVILAQIDERLDAWLPVIAAVQAGHLAEHGRHLQAVQIASQMPADGTERAADRAGQKPGRERYTWSQALGRYAPGHAAPAAVLGQTEIHQYEGPAGVGYLVISEHRIGQTVWRRVRGFGPETWMDRPWHEVVEGLP